MAIQMQLTAEPLGDQYHLKGYVGHYGLALADPTVALTLAGVTETFSFAETAYIEIDRLVRKADLDANLVTEARYQAVGFTSRSGSQPAGERTNSGTFEPYRNGVLIHKGLC